MINSFTFFLKELKSNWGKIIESQQIDKLCQRLKLKWRDRILSPSQTIQLFILQILHGNTAINHLRFFTKRGFTASAYCQARKRLPLELFKKLLKDMSVRFKRYAERWHGRRVYLVDGSTFSMPDTAKLRAYFGQPSGQKLGCGFPVAHFIALFHVGTGLIRRVFSGPLFSHDLSNFIKLHPVLKRMDLLIGDRAFCSFAHLALLSRRGVDAIFRMQQCQIVNFRARRSHSAKKGQPRSRWEKKLGFRDQLVTWFKPKTLPTWINEQQYQRLPATLLLRELCYDLHIPGFRTRHIILVTTLINAVEFPKEVLIDLYGQRWSIETNFNHLKTTMGMDVLHSRTVDGVVKEFYMFCIVYNLVRTVMIEAGFNQGVSPERISFIDALRYLLVSCSHHISHPLLVVPRRSNRFEPRAVKRRPKEYDLLTKTRKEYKKQGVLCLS